MPMLKGFRWLRKTTPRIESYLEDAVLSGRKICFIRPVPYLEEGDTFEQFGAGENIVSALDSVEVTVPTVTTDPATEVGQELATLNGILANDGGEACQVRFQYGLTNAYGTNTEWQSGKVTGNKFEQEIGGLTPNTPYHFRAQALNSAGTGNGADKTFTTKEAVIVNRAYALSRWEL